MANIEAALEIAFACIFIYFFYVLFAKEVDEKGEKKDHKDKDFAKGFFIWLIAVVTVLALIGVLKI